MFDIGFAPRVVLVRSNEGVTSKDRQDGAIGTRKK